MYDSEGDVDKKSRRINLTSTNKEGIEEIKELLRNYDIRARIRIVQRTPPRKCTYILGIQDRRSVEIFHNSVGFTINYKQENLKGMINTYKLFTTPNEEVLKLKPIMVELRKQGLSYEKIGKRLGVGTVTIWNHLRK
jgi:intein-encoded DNA endonuclease-like protein